MGYNGGCSEDNYSYNSGSGNKLICHTSNLVKTSKVYIIVDVIAMDG